MLIFHCCIRTCQEACLLMSTWDWLDTNCSPRWTTWFPQRIKTFLPFASWKVTVMSWIPMVQFDWFFKNLSKPRERQSRNGNQNCGCTEINAKLSLISPWMWVKGLGMSVAQCRYKQDKQVNSRAPVVFLEVWENGQAEFLHDVSFMLSAYMRNTFAVMCISNILSCKCLNNNFINREYIVNGSRVSCFHNKWVCIWIDWRLKLEHLISISLTHWLMTFF